MANKTQLSVGIVGAGAITRKSHLPVLMSTPNTSIAWIYDHRPNLAATLAGAYGIRSLGAMLPVDLPPCDVALLAIPVDVRGEYIEEFARRGTAVLCEKPFATSLSEHERLVAKFPAYRLGAGYMRRMFRSSLLLRQIVASGIFGRLIAMDVSEGNRSKGSGADASFLDDPRLGVSRGVLTDLGSHAIDLAFYVSGASDFAVRACIRVMDDSVDRKVRARVDLRGCATTRMSGAPNGSNSVQGAAVGERPGIELNFGVSWLDRQENQLRLKFANAMVWCGLGPAAEVYVGDPANPRAAISLSSGLQGAVTYNQAFHLEWMNFLDGVRESRESLMSARSALLTTSLVETLLTVPESSYD